MTNGDCGWTEVRVSEVGQGGWGVLTLIELEGAYYEEANIGES